MAGKAPEYRTTPGGGSVKVGSSTYSTDELNTLTNWKNSQRALAGQLLALAPGLIDRKDALRATNAMRREKLEQAIASGMIKGVEGGQEITASQTGLEFESDEAAASFWKQFGESTARGNLDRTREVRNKVRDRIKKDIDSQISGFLDIQSVLKESGAVEGSTDAFTKILTSADMGAALAWDIEGLQLKDGADGSQGVLDYQWETPEQIEALNEIAKDILDGNTERFAPLENVNVGEWQKVSEYYKKGASGSRSLNVDEDYGSISYNPLIERMVERDTEYIDEIKTGSGELLALYAMDELSGLLGGSFGANKPFAGQAAELAAKQRQQLNLQSMRDRSRYYEDSDVVRGGSGSYDFGDQAMRALASFMASQGAGFESGGGKSYAPVGPGGGGGNNYMTADLFSNTDQYDDKESLVNKTPTMFEMVPGQGRRIAWDDTSYLTKRDVETLKKLNKGTFKNFSMENLSAWVKSNIPTKMLQDGIFKIRQQGQSVVVSYGANDWAAIEFQDTTNESAIAEYDRMQRNPFKVHIYKGAVLDMLGPAFKGLYRGE